MNEVSIVTYRFETLNVLLLVSVDETRPCLISLHDRGIVIVDVAGIGASVGVVAFMSVSQLDGTERNKNEIPVSLQFPQTTSGQASARWPSWPQSLQTPVNSRSTRGSGQSALL